MPLKSRRKSSVNEVVIHLKHLILDGGKFENENESLPELTLKLSSYWKNEVKSRESLVKEQQSLMWGRASAALTELLLVNCVKPGEEEKVFSRMVTLCVLMSGLGSPRSDPVIKETCPALHSVIKVGDISRITDLSQPEKEQHILEVVQIVMGIRLFNKDCRKGGEGIDDLPELLARALEATENQLVPALEEARGRCEGLTAALNCLYRLDKHCESPELALAPATPIQQVKLMKSFLCLLWLQIFCLLELRSDLTDSDAHVKGCVTQLRDTLVQLHETVRYRAAIPTVQVYPLFVQLSQVWRQLQQESAVLSQISQWLHTLTVTIKKADSLQLGLFVSASPNLNKIPLPTPTGSKTQLKLRGFCPWTLVQTEGVLIIGKYVEGNYAFRSQEAATIWKQDGDRWHSALYRVISSNPELTDFLQVPTKPLTEPENKKTIATAEAEVQTETHPVRDCIDPDYEWSEWQLKRRALNLARLTRCLTKSQQTLNTSFRTNTATECTLYRHK